MITTNASDATVVWRSAPKGRLGKSRGGCNGCWVFWRDERGSRVRDALNFSRAGWIYRARPFFTCRSCHLTRLSPLPYRIMVMRTDISQVLAQTRGKVSGQNGAAEILGLNRSTLRARMQKLGIEKP
ncbi:MAG: hypothetical protein K9K79_09230 [Desulfohalobiaceae bacterium]|nr:hypothetical protein [Desulfohalobiaceae bacterium]